jgi:pimeloyl-ACP methyl ester carboxylesterase
MNKKLIVGVVTALVAGCVFSGQAFAKADNTMHPVIFAHGMLGFDQLLGIQYWGNDYGDFVGDPCDGFLEIGCNQYISDDQQAFATRVSPLDSSNARGTELADEIESYMATVGATHVNIVSHSQGGLDGRKAAKVLHDRTGYQVVKVLVSLSSPHRGSPVAKSILDRHDGIEQFVRILVDYLGTPLIYGEVGDVETSLKSLTYDDYDPNDGVITGAKAFNQMYNIDNTYIKHYASLITADEDNLNPILSLLARLLPDRIDADGWCDPANEDCDNDGAAGAGDGYIDDGDDDGLVGINSQQMGYRLKYTDFSIYQNISRDSLVGYVSDINQPNQTQSTSYRSLIKSDHLDMCGFGVIPYLIPDDFPEKEFFAAVIDYISENE